MRPRGSELHSMWRTVIQAASWPPLSAPCSRGIPVQKTVPQCHETTRGRLTWQCHRTQTIGLAGVALVQSATEAPTQTEMIQSRVQAHERAHEAEHFPSRAETCKQSFCGAVVVYYTCPDVPLTGVVGGRTQPAPLRVQASQIPLRVQASQGQRARRQEGADLAGRQKCRQTLGLRHLDPKNTTVKRHRCRSRAHA